jgi:hypothetical protein
VIGKVALAAALAGALSLGTVGMLRADGSEPAHPPPSPPPLSHPIVTTPVPTWLQKIRPHRHGRWVAVLPSPDRKTLLAQWLAECEIPFAYFVPTDSGEPQPVVSALVESIVVGWSADGRARVFLPKGTCGTGATKPGLYLVLLDGKSEFVEQ